MEHVQISQEQTTLVFGFLKMLFSDDVEGYWSTISKVDQARVYGMYKAAAESGGASLTFRDYVRDYIKADHAEMYEKVKEHPGISNRVRYTSDGEPLIYVFEDVKVTRVYIVETEVHTFPIVLTADANVNENDITAVWKVRLYMDQDYKMVPGHESNAKG